ncbi:MAG: hypothetical protein HQK75_14215 [Candidatus Magnetomorum sp.]|nr:hypothetical protein [Candidatus Magnetomorum sp.]
MNEKKITPENDYQAWLLLALVFIIVAGIVLTVFSHDKIKPQSPQELVATAFNQILTTKEWKPGMGQQPLMYHPAAYQPPVWHPLPPKQVDTQAGTQVIIDPATQQGQQKWIPLNN